MNADKVYRVGTLERNIHVVKPPIIRKQRGKFVHKAAQTFSAAVGVPCNFVQIIVQFRKQAALFRPQRFIAVARAVPQRIDHIGTGRFPRTVAQSSI